MTTAALVALEGIVGNELTHEDEVTEVNSLVKLYVQAFLAARDTDAGVELLADLLEHLKSLLQAGLVTGHTNIVPHYLIELLMDGVNAHQLRLIALLVLNVHQTVDLGLHTLLSLYELRSVGRRLLHLNLVREVVLHGVRNDEIAIAQTLHQCRST